jgi:hypothetical protein
LLEDETGRRRLQAQFAEQHDALRRDTPALTAQAILDTLRAA